VTFPHDRLRVLPYHRVLKDLGGRTESWLLGELERLFEVSVVVSWVPAERHEFGLYLGGRWRRLRARAGVTAGADLIGNLDVSVLQRHVLAPLFGIQDPRTSERISFVGGSRGLGELERLVDGGGWACAFALRPTGLEDLMAIADADGLMPPKSTWFDPKLGDGMFCHRLDPVEPS
jgi:uncharacterized protein (DUF1015 family)